MVDYLNVPVAQLIERNVAIGYYVRNYFGDIKLGEMTFCEMIDRYFRSGYAAEHEDKEVILASFAQFCQDIDLLQELPHKKIKNLLIADKEDKCHNISVSEIELKIGTVTAIVGPTNSGKSALLDDVAGLVAGSSITHRHILIDGHHVGGAYFAKRETRYTQRISLSTNRSTKNAETVKEYLYAHIDIFGAPAESVVTDIIEIANNLVEARIAKAMPIKDITDRQFKALLVAEVALTSTVPILLLDELESFGIDKVRAFELLRRSDRICILATHDPLLILMCNQRIVMHNGAITQLIATSDKEKAVMQELKKTEKQQVAYRETFRNGEVILF